MVYNANWDNLCVVDFKKFPHRLYGVPSERRAVTLHLFRPNASNFLDFGFDLCLYFTLLDTILFSIRLKICNVTAKPFTSLGLFPLSIFTIKYPLFTIKISLFTIKNFTIHYKISTIHYNNFHYSLEKISTIHYKNFQWQMIQ